MENRMQSRFISIFFILLSLLFISCSSGNERLISGRWALASRMVGNSPSSFWFKWNGNVVASWEKRDSAEKSKGEYKFIDDTHIRIEMDKGYYQGNTYYYEIIKLDKDKLILRSKFQDIKLRKI